MRQHPHDVTTGNFPASGKAPAPASTPDRPAVPDLAEALHDGLRRLQRATEDVAALYAALAPLAGLAPGEAGPSSSAPSQPPQPAPSPTRTGLLDVAAVATRLDVSPKTVRRLVDRGALHPVRVGRLLRFDAAAVDAYVRANAARPAPPVRRPKRVGGRA